MVEVIKQNCVTNISGSIVERCVLCGTETNSIMDALCETTSTKIGCHKRPISTIKQAITIRKKANSISY